MRAIVCGGRDFWDQQYVFDMLDEVNASHGPITALAHGGATGADSIAGLWAALRRIPCSVYNADWQTYGKSAGWIRNAEMLQAFKPDYIVAFNGGKGTRDMCDKGFKAGKTILQYTGGRPRPVAVKYANAVPE